MSDKSQIEKLQNAVLNFRNERNWAQFHNLKDMVISLNLEAAELLELTQWQTTAELSELSEKAKTKFSHELADILYWLLIISHDLNIDLEQSVHEKLALNMAKYPVSEFKNSRAKARAKDA